MHTRLICLVLITFSCTTTRINAQLTPGKVLAIVEGIDALWNLWERLTRETSMLVFKTDSNSPISLEVNGKYVGKISRNSVISVEVEAGYGTYKAYHSDGKVFFNSLQLTGDTKHEIFVSARNVTLNAPGYRLTGRISGNTVNFRREPVIADNFLGQLHLHDPVEILDLVTFPARESDRLTIRRTRFIAEDGQERFDVLKGIAVTRLGPATNGYTRVRFKMNNGRLKQGYILTKDLERMSNTWYKIRVGGRTGYVYGKYIAQA